MSPVAEAGAPMIDDQAREKIDLRPERFENLHVDEVFPSPTNPRTHFDSQYITELALSIATKGLIQPIVVRPQLPAPVDGLAHFEIVAGECRWRATRQAGLPVIPAIIREYTDEQVLECQLEENIHRTDLTPLEQAVAYRRLIDTNPTKHSAESIATRIGKSVAWVWDRLKLNDLVPEAKSILEHDWMTVGHAILIARLKPEDQQRCIALPRENHGFRHDAGLWRYDAGFEWDEASPRTRGQRRPTQYEHWKPCSVRELEAWIRDHVRFDVTHAAKAQPFEFEQVAVDVADRETLPGRGKKVIAITSSYRVADDARDEQQRTYGRDAWRRADGREKSKTCEHSVLGVFAAGLDRGQALEVCVNRDKCRVHFGDVIRAREKNQKLRESGQAKKAAKNEATQRAREATARKQRELAEVRQQRVAAAAIDQALGHVTGVSDEILYVVLDHMIGIDVDHAAFKARFGIKVKWHDNVPALKALTGKKLAAALAFAFLHNQAAYSDVEFSKALKLYGVDLAKVRASVEKAETEHAATPAAAKRGKKR